MNLDLNKTLEELDGEKWGEPDFQSSMVLNTHRLRRIPLKDFLPEDLRLMIGQNLNLEHLVPLALTQLEKNPLLEGNFYPGDVLVKLLAIPANFWTHHHNLQETATKTALRGLELANNLSKMECNLTLEPLSEAWNRFRYNENTQ